MCSFWRNIRLAPKHLCRYNILERIEKFSESATGNKFRHKKPSQTKASITLNMSGKKHIEEINVTDQDESDVSFNERDSGFISDKDLSFNCGEWSFGCKNNYTVCVEGNIGSGKTTLLRYFRDSPIVETLEEPIEQWTNIQGHNALKLLYEDPKRWSFSFNMYAQLTRVRMHTKEYVKPIKMMERSLYSTRHCFVENDFRSNMINGMEYTILTNWYDWLVKSQKADVDLIVYVRADPEVCFDRMKTRSRKEEELVPYSLIKALHDLHEDWLIKQTTVSPKTPVIVLDANKGYSEMKDLYETRRQEILCGCV